MKFEVFFEIFNKKMKTTIIAKSEDEARLKVINAIKFHKVVEQSPNYNKKNGDEIINYFKDIFSGKKK